MLDSAGAGGYQCPSLGTGAFVSAQFVTGERHSKRQDALPGYEGSADAIGRIESSGVDERDK